MAFEPLLEDAEPLVHRVVELLEASSGETGRPTTDLSGIEPVKMTRNGQVKQGARAELVMQIFGLPAEAGKPNRAALYWSEPRAQKRYVGHG